MRQLFSSIPGQVLDFMLVLVGLVKGAEHIVREMFGL